MKLSGLRIALVGPVPPPSGGMANQTGQLAALLRADGATVQLLAVNLPWPPHWAWLGRIKFLRAMLRLPLHVWRLWRVADTVDLFHIMANSGWSWHLHAAPAVWIAMLKGKPSVLNYRGGEAAAFFARSPRLVTLSLRRADSIVVPSAFLAAIFEQYGFAAQIVPNVIDLGRFAPRGPSQPRLRPAGNGPHILVARNLETIYDNASAIRAFAVVRQTCPGAKLCIAGSGPQLPSLQQLVATLGLADSVTFTGRIDNSAMSALYQASDIVLNPSLADNMPVSVLEALACGVPLVSTDAGGIPHLLQHQASALLVPPGDVQAMAQALLTLIRSPSTARRLAANGLLHVAQFSWDSVAPLLMAQYRRVLRGPRSGLYTRLVAAVLFPLHEKCKRHDSLALRRQMELSQWWSAERLRQWQLQRLRSLLEHAQAHVPYYRALFASIGFDAGQVDTLADLVRLPLLVKADIGFCRNAFKSSQARGLQRFNTGGSSGEPLVFYIGRERISHDVAAKWRATRWWGVDIGDREVVVWGSPIELKVQDRLRRLRDRLLRSTLLPAFEMSANKVDGFIRQIRRIRPRMLFGYPSALSHIARRAADTGTALDGLGVRVAFVTSERLYDEQRDTIGRAFGCPVANGYGARDAGFIAHECPEGGMHITAEDIIVEIVDAAGQPLPPGASGAIVVTHLASRDFPFIRYATGDVGTLASEPCACGRGLPLLKHIDGRSTDFVVAHDGTVMHGLALVYILRDLPQVRGFKIIQESLLLTRILLVALPVLDQAARLAIVAGFQARLGAAVAIVIEEMTEISPDTSGKFRYVVSKILAT
ncbi:glycosyltransferase [Janthinobacterium agaricidamnosum]|uniref:Glycosyl transferases group 1 family protein n=1 Tax=Janthinobacterium agaricidamnosum NBRC 102515 = DSM 9628 TaxID=1349767 RepID=W0V5W2_9BURK|nr:glycosyltransferase [Janthinobacterium agaricidamnosum]CDG83276.1 glycosyl transferases group 1 family protein [Janthinobacterium agaricidamnosum NBRC 102515 = DSM 9628]